MIPWYILKFYAQKHVKFTSGTVVLLILTLIFYSYLKWFLAVWSFVVGMAVTYVCVSPNTLLPNLLPMYSRKKKLSSQSDELTLMKTVCTVCGQRKCPRHRPELNILAFQPWTNLEIRQKIDQSLEEFFSIIFKEFVYTWYKDLSTDEEFADELRSNIRFIAAVFLRRAKKIDIPNLVIHKLVKAAIEHLDCCIRAKVHAEGSTDFQQCVIDYLGQDTHVAMWSRKAELEYLRRMAESLFPYILRPQALHSKSTCALLREMLAGSVLLPAVDAVANPDLVNNLILIFLDNTPPPVAKEPPSPMVPYLEAFAQPLNQNKSCLRLELKEVINKDTPELLYPFMQFLKSEAAVNVLQFCLACDDFNERILSPSVSQSELVELHNMAKDLYNSYCAPTALDRIKFDEQIVKELEGVIKGPPDGVVKLRTSTPLFKAYEHAYNLLENNFLPLFHQSDDYYRMVCGGRPGALSRNQSSMLPPSCAPAPRQAKKKEFGLSHFGNKLKEVFKTSSEDKTGSMDSLDDLDLPPAMTSATNVDEEMDDPLDLPDPPKHDLSTWRVTVPRIGARPDPDNPKKQFFVFIIDVRRVDVPEGVSERSNWIVARRYTEFYVLEQKLVEFHGEFDCQLPPKKTFGTKNQEFIEGRREVFELYVQKLLTKPHLKGSELLKRFLSSDKEEFTTGLFTDINLGKLVKAMPMKLVKERGQHLDPFLQAFFQSTEAPRPRPSKLERRGSDASQRSTSSEKMYSSLYENNAGCGFSGMTPSTAAPPIVTREVEGVFDSLIYVARHVYKVPAWFHHILMTIKIVGKNTIESYMEWYLDNKIEKLKQEHRVVSLIHLLRDTLFYDTDPPRTEAQKRARYKEVVAGSIDYIPKAFAAVIGTKSHVEGTKFILECLQQPKLNKQLTFVFLDIVVQELFPELRETTPSPT
ncbi:sorting nexin-14-like isoform X1 [Haliotis rufescens]|uniref:sorting nexin-14-like isoform X1 n=1 Tax=Haliotis rufescens TaxID=6454 RepID=UPI001EAFB63B|nr:sorting nexin-14-like isoform X1 [Haliotis rufescens]